MNTYGVNNAANGLVMYVMFRDRFTFYVLAMPWYPFERRLVQRKQFHRIKPAYLTVIKVKLMFASVN